MDKKNIIIISIIAIAVIIVVVLLFIVNPFSAEPPASVPNETFRTPTQTQPADTQSVQTEKPQEKPAEKSSKPSMAEDESADYDTYVVKEGETLESIADKLYGDKTKWFKIFAANESDIDWYDSIYVGQKLKIPAPDSK